MWTGRGGSFPPESNATGNVKSHDAQMFFDEEKKPVDRGVRQQFR